MLLGIGNILLLNPPGMILRPDAEFVKKPTSIGMPMRRVRSLEPVVLRFQQSPPQKHNAPSLDIQNVSNVLFCSLLPHLTQYGGSKAPLGTTTLLPSLKD